MKLSVFPVLLSLAVACGLIMGVQGSASAAGRLGRERALDSLVQVIVQTRFGTVRRCSGFMFSTNGYVATAYHAVSDAVSIQVFHADHGVFDVTRVRRIDRRSDVAVLAVAGVDRPNFGGSRVGDWRGLKVGDQVRVLHHPAYGEVVECAAPVTAIGYPQQIASAFAGQYAPELPLIQVEGPFDAGSAGGLLCGENYEVVGMLLGGEGKPGAKCKAHALTSTYLAPLMLSTFDGTLSDLRTNYKSDQDFFDTFFGPAPQPVDSSAAMPESYIVWFTPTSHTEYADFEFTNEMNDKIDKNWFYTVGLTVDGRALREWSASRIFILPATRNPWDLTDSAERYVHFDADSRFSKRIYRNRETEERIMTRHLLAMPLAKGMHSLSYENKGANYKSTGIKRVKTSLASAEIKLLDITGLSLVSMRLLPSAPVGAGEGRPVRYELERKPYQDKELNWSVRRARIALEP